MPEGKKSLEMKLNALKNVIEEKITRLRFRAFGDKPKMSMLELRPVLNRINIHGIIVFKNKKGCAHYYRLLNDSRMKCDCWSNARITHEN